ncbi:MAG: transposase [Coriobacteriales bacterium]|nr:transposase [Coriobacteriales bacterium]
MYVSYNVVDGNEYATVVRSVRDGARVTKEDRVYLGRVVDKARGVYRSRERGLFTYDLATDEFGDAPQDVAEPARRNARRVRPVLAVSFGDAFLLDSFLRSSGLMACADACGHAEPDTVRALLAFYVLSSLANCHARDWWSLTYARLLYPSARMASQKVSECLADLGSEDAKRGFTSEYLSLVGGSGDAGGILIDSTGLPNSCRLPVTAVSNHNGEVSEEVRLIYVVQRGTGLPLFFRYVADNVIDVSTVTRTIAELKGMGVDTKFAILDAGYYTNANADALMAAGVSFLMRMKPNFAAYKEVVAGHLATLEGRENAVMHNGRLVYVKRVECALGAKGDRRGWAYLCLDTAMRRELERDAARRAAEAGPGGAEAFDSMAAKGVFVLVSTRRIAREKLLPLYYTRDRVEKVFEIAKQGGKALPVSVQTEDTCRGHLLMCFMATAAVKMMSDVLSAHRTSLTVESMLEILHEQHAIEYDGQLVTTEPVRKMNEAYRAFGIKCPETISLPVVG